jgi:4-amino-4-deoxy-L-arabinose transferase-like glycosyltransferase
VLWAAGVLLPLALLPAAVTTVPTGGAWSRWALFVIVALLVGAAAVRVWRLEAVPAYVHGDAAVVGLESISVRETDHRRFVAAPDRPYTEDSFGWYWLPNSTFFMQGIGMDLFGADLFGFRAGSMIFGMGSLVAHVVLAWSLFGPGVAVLSLIPLTTYHWHLFLSRSGHAYVQATFFAAWTMALLALGMRRGSRRSLYLCGVFAALSMLSVFAARVAPVIVGVFALTELLRHRDRARELVRRFSLVAWGGAMAIAPALPGLIINWAAYVGHTRDVAVSSEHVRRHMSGSIGSDDILAIVWSQFWSSLRIFLWGTDGSLQYGFRGRFVDPLLIGFAIVGLFVCIRRWPNAAYRLPVVWFSLTFVLGSVLTVDAPSMSRLPPLVTLPYLFAAVGMVACVELVRPSYGTRWAAALSAVLVAMCLGAAWWNFDQFFRVYTEQRPADLVTLLGRRIAEEDPDVEIRLALASENQALHWDHGTLRIFNRTRLGKDVADLKAETADALPRRLFVLFADRLDQLDQLKSAFPEGSQVVSDTTPEVILFRTWGGGSP